MGLGTKNGAQIESASDHVFATIEPRPLLLSAVAAPPPSFLCSSFSLTTSKEPCTFVKQDAF